jgi:signal recognition particle subunit SRP9
MYKTFSAIILNRFEMLNTRLLSQVANVKPKPRETLAVPTTEARAGTPLGDGPARDDPMNGVGAGATTTTEGKKDEKKSGGGKKKKKGKK